MAIRITTYAALAVFAVGVLGWYVFTAQELVAKEDRQLANVISAISSTKYYYVNPSGNDSNSGTTAGSPFKTIKKALSLAQPGEAVVLAAGTYREDIETIRNGQKDKPIVITGPDEAVVVGAGNGRIFQIYHDYHILDGFTIDGKFASADSKNSYRDKLVYVQGKETRSGVTGLRIINMDLKNGGGECMRLRYYAQNNEIAYNTFTNCGVHDYVYSDGGKNGEGIYIGTAPEQTTDGKNPTSDVDRSDNNWIHHNTFNTQGNECVDIKEGSSGNIVENNSCTGQKDPNSAGFDSRGNGNIFRFNKSFENVGAGIRLGGDAATDGINNYVYANVITGNKNGGIKVMRMPQAKICSNSMSDNDGGNGVGDYGKNIDPLAACTGTLPPASDTLAPPSPSPTPTPSPSPTPLPPSPSPPVQDDGSSDDDTAFDWNNPPEPPDYEDPNDREEDDTPAVIEPPENPEPEPTILPQSFEAESGVVTSPMKKVSDSNASGKAYVVQTDKSGTGYVTYAFSVAHSGYYVLRARVIAARSSQNSVYYAFGTNARTVLHFPDNIASWSWIDGPRVYLQKGTHVFTIWNRERNTKIDAFELVLKEIENDDDGEDEEVFDWNNPPEPPDYDSD